MLRTFTAASMLALACALPLHEAAAQDPVGGGILGGIAGGLLGGAIGGRGGAIAGAIIGGTTGAAIAALDGGVERVRISDIAAIEDLGRGTVLTRVGSVCA